MNFNKTDKVIISFSILVILLFSYLLYDDTLLFRRQKSSYKKIGLLSFSSNDVRRKPVESLNWTKAFKEEVIHEKDSIFTGEKSKAKIMLDDGGYIQLDENSLITLSFKEGQIELNLKYGEVETEIAKSNKVQLKSGNENLKLETALALTKIKLKKTKNGTAKLKLLQGQLDIKTNTNDTVKVDTQDTLFLTKTGNVKKAPTGTIELLTPDKITIKVVNLNQGFYLNWHSMNVENIKLYISKTSDFLQTSFLEENIKSKILVKNLPQGDYFWKLEGTDYNNKKISSETHQFKLLLLEPPQIIQPTMTQYKFETKTDLNLWNTDIDFSWTSNNKNFNYQLSRDKDFRELLLNESISKKIMKKKLSQGAYFFRVRSVDPDALTPWSPIVPFEILVTSTPLLVPETPKLITKNLTMTTNSKRFPASVKPVLIKWNKANFAESYALEIDRNPQFHDPKIIFLKKLEYQYSTENSSKNYFRVKAISEDGLSSNYSDVGQMTLLLNEPLLLPVKSIKENFTPTQLNPPERAFSLTWQSVPAAKNYIVEYSESADFKVLSSVKTQDTHYELKTSKPGTYHFRVIASDSLGNPVSPQSNIEKAIYDFREKVIAPELSLPRNNLSLFMQNNLTPPIWLNWISKENKYKYEIQVSVNKNFNNPMISQITTEKRFLIKKQLPLGKVFWRVRSLNSDSPSEWTETREFTLYHQKNDESF